MKQDVDSYGGFTYMKARATGWFHLERFGPRDWFVTPEGHAFFPLSLAHLFTCDSRPAIDRFYGGEQQAWMQDWFGRCQELGFNCSLSGATSSCRNRTGFVDIDMAERTFQEANFPYAAGVFLIPHPHELPEGEERMDVFDPSFARRVEALVGEACARYAGDPLVLGYYFGFGPFIRADLWVQHLLSLPAGAPGREALVDALKARYKDDVDEMNRTYHIGLTRIDDLRRHEALAFEPVLQRDFDRPTDPLERRRREDLDCLVRLLAVAAYVPACKAIRRHDPNHLILGPYVKETSFSLDTWQALAPHFDVLAPQHSHRDIDLGILRRQTGRPVILSDEITGPYLKDRSHGVRSFEHKADLYRRSLECHARNPSVSGVCYCGTLWDLDEGPMRSHGHLEGLYDQQGNPRPALVETVSQANASLHAVAIEPAGEDRLAAMYADYFRAWDASRL